jgi:phosphatidylserine/phosphatidylglycerophosphate/cardiolipin synthase-like enzyme
VKLLAEAAGRAVDELGPEPVRLLAGGLDDGLGDTALRALSSRSGFADAVTTIRAAQRTDEVDERSAATYLRGVADGHERGAARERVETVWSGPRHHTVPVRSTAAVLVGLIDAARDDLLLTTYSARPHPPVQAALHRARGRNVRIRAVVETLQGAGSALADVQPAAAFRDIPGVQLWHWPTGRRPNPSARMHAKIAVADASILLVSSTNLTRSGIEHNIESGILVRGGTAPRRAVEHIDRLAAEGELERLSTGEWR